MQREEALFEQRKEAAKEDIEHAEKTRVTLQAAEKRLNEEMNQLGQLSEYVANEDAEAEKKLDQANELAKSLREMELTVKEDFQQLEKQKSDVSESCMALARERIALLKHTQTHRENNNTALGHGQMSHNKHNFLTDPSLRRTLTSLQNDLNKLRE